MAVNVPEIQASFRERTKAANKKLKNCCLRVKNAKDDTAELHHSVFEKSTTTATTTFKCAVQSHPKKNIQKKDPTRTN